MKIEEQKEIILSNIAVGTGVKAKLANSSIIADLLRKHYSNVPRTMVQEYVSNARDAHRESGYPMKELRVSLPSLRSPFLEVRDFGNTMTEERLFTNFINYGDSTKRGSNDETGGFGIGSKIAYAYTPTFYLILYKDGMESLYQASTENEALGELTLLSKKPSKKERGFSVKIPVNPDDFDKICRYFYDITYYWKEEIQIANFSEDEIDSNWKNKNFLRTDNFVWDLNNTSAEKKSIILIDGIPYPYYSAPTLGLPNFKTGEIKVSINREQFMTCSENSKAINDALTLYNNEEKLFVDFIVSSIQGKSFEYKSTLKSKMFDNYDLMLDVKSEQIIRKSNVKDGSGLIHERGDGLFTVFFDLTDVKYNVFANKRNKTNSNYRCWDDTLTSFLAKDYSLFTATTVSFPNKEITKNKYPREISKMIIFRSDFDLLKRYESFINVVSLKDYFSKIAEKQKIDLEIRRVQSEQLAERQKKEREEQNARYLIQQEKEKAEKERQQLREFNAKDCTKKIVTGNWEMKQYSYSDRFEEMYFITESEYNQLSPRDSLVFFFQSIFKKPIVCVSDVAEKALIDSGANSYKILIEANKEELARMVSDHVFITAIQTFSYDGVCYNNTNKIDELLKSNHKYWSDTKIFTAHGMANTLSKVNKIINEEILAVRESIDAKLRKNQAFISMIEFCSESYSKRSILSFFLHEEIANMFKKEQ